MEQRFLVTVKDAICFIKKTARVALVMRTTKIATRGITSTPLLFTARGIGGDCDRRNPFTSASRLSLTE